MIQCALCSEREFGSTDSNGGVEIHCLFVLSCDTKINEAVTKTQVQVCTRFGKDHGPRLALL